METIYELALFAGAGGGILGGRLLGWRTVCAVEIDEYARRVLLARQEDGCLEPFPIWSDVRSFTKRNNATRRFIRWLRGIRGCLVISGGFPCQDISAAGKGAGIEGERSGLWREYARIIGEVRPRYVFVENSPMLTVRGLGRVLGDLAALGYDARWGVLGAHHAGAPHKRDRIWILAWLADSDGAGCAREDAPQSEGREQAAEPAGAGDDVADTGGGRCGGAGEREIQQPGRAEAERAGEAVADTARVFEGRAEQRAERERAGAGGEPGAFPDAEGECGGAGLREAGSIENGDQSGEACGDVSHADDASGELLGAAGRVGWVGEPLEGNGGGWWDSEPDVGRVADGVAARVDRLRGLGNGQVPAVVVLAWETLLRLKTSEV